jgi:signal transduction histidine kinase
MAIPIFLLSMGLLFLKSRNDIFQEGEQSAFSALNTSMQQVRKYMMAVETATNSNLWLIEENFQPDSLLAISNRIVRLNSHVSGCSITAEPNMFPSVGRHFSAYTIREGDSIVTQREAEYDYYSKEWYSAPIEQDKACWIDPFDDYTEGTLSNSKIIASYCKPIYKDEQIVGVISSDLSLNSLDKVINTVTPPYPSAYFVLIGGDGSYLTHPDSTLLFSKSDYIDHIAGRQGTKHLLHNGRMCQVSYQPIEGTDWSLAIVCPDSEILKSYNHLPYLIVALILIGLLVILWLCRRAVNQAISPLNTLLAYSQKISEGQFGLTIPFTGREDAIGQLQNSFAMMQQSINEHIGSIQRTVIETKERNEELTQATKLAEEAVRQKAAFIQDVSHQIRTPLNIIMGFAQVLRDNITSQNGHPDQSTLEKEEIANITDMMKHNAAHLDRMIKMLFDSSDDGISEERKSRRNEDVSPNKVGRECIGHTLVHFPNMPIRFETEVPDDFYLQTSHLYLMRTLRELLYNAAKYSDGQHISLHISQTEDAIFFTVEDVGTGISEESEDIIFSPFVKVDNLSEGLGLGLPLSKRHALSLGGDLILDNTYHDGCRFILKIPK